MGLAYFGLGLKMLFREHVVMVWVVGGGGGGEDGEGVGDIGSKVLKFGGGVEVKIERMSCIYLQGIRVWCGYRGNGRCGGLLIVRRHIYSCGWRC